MVAMGLRKLVAVSLAATTLAEPVEDAAALVQQTARVHDQGAQQQAGIKDDLKNLVGVLTNGVVNAVKTKVAADVKAQVQAAQGVNASGGVAVLSAAQQGGELVQGGGAAGGRTSLATGLAQGATSAFSGFTDALASVEIAKRRAGSQKALEERSQAAPAAAAEPGKKTQEKAPKAVAFTPPARSPALPQKAPLNMRKRLQQKRQQARNKPTAPPSKKLCPTCTPISDYKSIPVAAAPTAELVEEKHECTCLTWKEAFTSRGVACGMGLELYSKKDSSTAHDVFQGEACDDLFKQFDTNACINAHMGEQDGQWCYVSHKCSELNGGWRVPGTDGKWSTNVKMCSKGQDKYLSDQPPSVLSTVAKMTHIDVGHLVKMAYPTVHDVNWQDVSHLFSSDLALAKVHVDEKQAAKMEEVVQSGVPVVWGSESGRPPFGVTMGMKAYEVDANTFHPGHTHLACKHDCSSDETM